MLTAVEVVSDCRALERLESKALSTAEARSKSDRIGESLMSVCWLPASDAYSICSTTTPCDTINSNHTKHSN